MFCVTEASLGMFGGCGMFCPLIVTTVQHVLDGACLAAVNRSTDEEKGRRGGGGMAIIAPLLMSIKRGGLVSH